MTNYPPLRHCDMCKYGRASKCRRCHGWDKYADHTDPAYAPGWEPIDAGDTARVAGDSQGSHCPECGPDVYVDEDGCCATCGRDALWYRDGECRCTDAPVDDDDVRRCPQCLHEGATLDGVRQLTADRDAALAKLAETERKFAEQLDGIIANAPACGACAEGLFCGSITHAHDPGCVVAKLAAAEARLADYEDDQHRVMAEQCAPDERHCTCVPVLRRALAAAEARESRMRELLHTAMEPGILPGPHPIWQVNDPCRCSACELRRDIDAALADDGEKGSES